MNGTQGHRDRLRQSFNSDPASFTEVQRLELLLTYVIPRRDVAPLAEDLVSRFGHIENIITAPKDELAGVPGIGEYTLAFFQLLQTILSADMSSAQTHQPDEQLTLFDLQPEIPTQSDSARAKPRQMRVFANDEIANTLDFLPKAAQFDTIDAYKSYLGDRLPYNAAETRKRRASYIIDRFYPQGRISIPLTYYSAHCSSQTDLKPVVFYHLLIAEPVAARVAEDLVWPALPLGHIEREGLREFVLRYLPDASASSQKNMLRALFNTYTLLGIGTAKDSTLRFQLHHGSLESFLYLLTSQFPQPGIYPYDSLYSGPLHRWLLWDREWLRKQLYNLQDLGILAKISEIDTVKQFTLAMDQPMALQTFYEHPDRKTMVIRDQSERPGSEPGE